MMDVVMFVLIASGWVMCGIMAATLVVLMGAKADAEEDAAAHREQLQAYLDAKIAQGWSSQALRDAFDRESA